MLEAVYHVSPAGWDDRFEADFRSKVHHAEQVFTKLGISIASAVWKPFSKD